MFTDSHGRTFYHPYRKVGDRYHSLLPLYEWMKLRYKPANELTQADYSSQQPMTDWVGCGSLSSYGRTSYKVVEVVKEGLLIEAESVSKLTSSSKVIFLKNYPYMAQVVDGDRIEFVAMKCGTYQYTTTTGARATVEALDYGTPYDPFKLPKQATTNTNSPSH